MFKTTTIDCGPIFFWGQVDEDIFFYGLKKIECVEIVNTVHWAIVPDKLTIESLEDLAHHLYRYRAANMESLAQFFPEGYQKGYPWYKKVFPKKKK